MKKIVVGFILLSSIVALAACGNKGEETSNDKVITVAAQAPPMTDVVKKAAEVAKKEGWEIRLVQVNDNVAYNDMVASKEADASFAQHTPFMMKYNAEKEASLVAIQPIYDAKVGFYSKDYQTVADIPAKSKVAIPNDASNEGRALAILADEGLITLKEGVGTNATTKDVIENPKAFEWLAVDLLNLAEAYSEPGVALVYNYPTYISKIGLKPSDALFLEANVDERFSIQLVAREDNENSEKIKALKKAMTSEEVRTFLIEEHGETLLPSF
ncbi:MetQ/NlpA family ABC transporter substrate-binding protein [Enterococcus sp. LJL98]